MENKILSSIYYNRDAYDSILPVLDRDNSLSDIGKLLFERADVFYDTDPQAKRVDIDIIKSTLERDYPKQASTLITVVDRLDPDVSSPNVLKEYQELRRHNISMRLSKALLDGDHRLAEELMLEYKAVEDNIDNAQETSEVFVAPSISQFASEFSEENLIKLYPKALNDQVGGGVMRGHHILIYARPETGKSLVSINMAVGFLKQGLKVLYVGNEDPMSAMTMRFTNRITELNRMDILSNPEQADQIAYEGGMKNLIFAALSPGTFREIRGLIDRHKPDVLFVDQLRNINLGSDGLTNVLERAGMEMRAIAKKYGLLAISVTQAGDSATDKLVLSMSDVDSSKTGLPATIDLMIGVGVDDRFEAEDKRMISITKNKISGIHVYFPVRVDRTISKVFSV